MSCSPWFTSKSCLRKSKHKLRSFQLDEPAEEVDGHFKFEPEPLADVGFPDELEFPKMNCENKDNIAKKFPSLSCSFTSFDDYSICHIISVGSV